MSTLILSDGDSALGFKRADIPITVLPQEQPPDWEHLGQSAFKRQFDDKREDRIVRKSGGGWVYQPVQYSARLGHFRQVEYRITPDCPFIPDHDIEMMTNDLKDALDTRYGESDKVGVCDRDDYYHVSFGEYGYRIRSEDEGYTLTIAPLHDNLD